MNREYLFIILNENNYYYFFNIYWLFTQKQQIEFNTVFIISKLYIFILGNMSTLFFITYFLDARRIETKIIYLISGL